MTARHQFELRALCPANGALDVYEVTIEVNRLVRCEDLLELAATYREKKIFQEDLTNQLAMKLNCHVVTIGHHCGQQVKTRCEAYP
jgi:NADPH-dependent 7-cyano-7-deazaguanine reductase QueF